MPKEELLPEFFKHFKVALTNTNIYPEEHPAFKNTVNKFRGLIKDILRDEDQLRIIITPQKLVVDNSYWEGERIYRELAKYLHERKVKAIVIKKEINYAEISQLLKLLVFAEKVGKEELTDKPIINNFIIEELDYSSLLSSEEGEVIKDVWRVIIEDNKAPQDIENILKGKKIKVQQLIYQVFEEASLKQRQKIQKLIQFLEYLKEKDNPYFREGGEQLIISLAERFGDLPKDKLYEKLKGFLNNVLDTDIIADSLLKEELSEDALKNALKLFSLALSRDKNDDIAHKLREKLSGDFSSHRATVENKFKALALKIDDSIVSDSYKKALLTWRELKSCSQDKIKDSDDEYSYRYLLLNMLALESNKFILKNIIFDLIKILHNMEDDYHFLGSLVEMLKNNKDKFKDPEVVPLYNDIKNKLTPLLDNLLREKSDILTPEDIVKYTYFLEDKELDYNLYIEKILDNGKINSKLIVIFLNLFPREFARLEKVIAPFLKSQDEIVELIEEIKSYPLPFIVTFLKYLFKKGGLKVKIQVFRILSNSSFLDKDMIKQSLRVGFFIRKEVLKLIMNQPSAVKEEIAKYLLLIFNPWGLRDKVVIENLRLIGELEIREAKPVVGELLKRKYSWWRSPLKRALIETQEKLGN